MPIKCPDGSKPRFRVKRQGKGKAVRLAFCGSKAVEAIPMKKNKSGKLKALAYKRKKK